MVREARHRGSAGRSRRGRAWVSWRLLDWTLHEAAALPWVQIPSEPMNQPKLHRCAMHRHCAQLLGVWSQIIQGILCPCSIGPQPDPARCPKNSFRQSPSTPMQMLMGIWQWEEPQPTLSSVQWMPDLRDSRDEWRHVACTHLLVPGQCLTSHL